MIAIDLSKQQALDVDPKAIKQINFTGNVIGNNYRVIFFIIEKAKETILDFSQGTVKVFKIYFTLILYQYKMSQYNTLNVKFLIHNLIEQNLE